MSTAGATQRFSDTQQVAFSRRASTYAVPFGAALAAAAGAVLYVQDPTKPSSVFPPCVFHAVTGLWCPGCGGTRAAHALLHGDLVGAFSYNALFVVALPLIVLQLVRWGRAYRQSYPVTPQLDMSARTGFAIAVALLTFAIVRNLPFDPFALLAPGGA